MPHPIRYTFILGLVALATGLAAVGGWRYARASAPVNGPIILISIDSLRADHLPAYGYRGVRTPAIDGLARDGVLFERAYAHVPQTLPSHVSLMTGRLPFETGVRDNAGFSLKPTERSLPEVLRDRGYATAGVVSTFALRKETGISRGFTLFDDEMAPATPEQSIGGLRRDGTESERIAERWLESAGTSRAFLFLHLYEPHAPHSPPERFGEYSPYDAQIAYADEIVGRLMRHLKAHQLYDRSTIVLLADHGEGLGDHGEQAHGLFIYDEAMHVPLIVKQAAGEGAGRRVRALVQHVDVAPTILDLAKAPIPGTVRGRSLRPLLEANGQLATRPAYSESFYGRSRFGWSEVIGLTDGRYHLIRAPHPELYDLERDPAERHNLIEDQPEEAKRLQGELDRLTAGTSISQPAAVPTADYVRFAALGYVGRHLDAPEPRVESDSAPDAKDYAGIVETYRRASNLSVSRQYPQATELLLAIAREHSELSDVWRAAAETAVRAGRLDQALDAYKRVLALQPTNRRARLDAASVLLKMRRADEARHHASKALDDLDSQDRTIAAAAHELLARIALARHDRRTVREEAELASRADPSVPIVPYMEGRLLYDLARFGEALEQFEPAIEGLGRPFQELHYYAAEALTRVGRFDEAETQFLAELDAFPETVRAWIGLASLYRTMERHEEAEQTLDALIRVNPTPDAYSVAARFWMASGDRRQALALTTQALRLFPPKPERRVRSH